MATILYSFLSLTGNSVLEQSELTLPENVIEGSVRAFVSVLGKRENVRDKICRLKAHY